MKPSNLSCFAIAIALAVNAAGNNAYALHAPDLVHPPEAPKQPATPDSSKSVTIPFSVAKPKIEEGEIATGMSQMTMNYMLFKNGCKETDPAKFLQDWFAQQGVPVEIRTAPSMDANNLSWFMIKPKNAQDQQKFDELKDAFQYLTQLPNGHINREDLTRTCRRPVSPDMPTPTS